MFTRETGLVKRFGTGGAAGATARSHKPFGIIKTSHPERLVAPL